MEKMKARSINGLAFICRRQEGRVYPDLLTGYGFGYRPVSCIGQVSAGLILNAFEYGAEGVVLIGCPDSECRHRSVPEIARKEVQTAQEILSLLGYPREVVGFMSSGEPAEIEEQLEKFGVEKKTRALASEQPAPVSPAVEWTSGGFVCLNCGRCSGVCPVSRTGLGFSPRRLIQEAIEQARAVPTRAVYACLGCDLCSAVCPSGKKITDEVIRLRVQAFKNNDKPVLAHGGIVQTVARMMGKSRGQQNRLSWLPPELRVVEKGDTALWVGCAPYFAVLFRDLGVNPLGTVGNAVRILNHLGIQPVILRDERCCGHDCLWQGDVDTAGNLARHNIAILQAAGVKRVIFTCPECLRTFKLDYPLLAGATGLELIHISEFLLQQGFKPLTSSSKNGSIVATYQDPCRLGRQLGVFSAPREVIGLLENVELREMAHQKESALCCGGKSWLECGAAVKMLQERRLAEAQAVGAEVLVTACSKCEIHLRCAQINSPGGAGIRVVNIVDFVCEESKIGE